MNGLAQLAKAFETAPESVKRRLRRGIAVLLASGDGRYLEQLDIHLSQLERFADDLKAGGK